MAIDDQPIVQQLWGARFRPITLARLLTVMIVLIQLLVAAVDFAFGERGPKLLGHVLASSTGIALAWGYLFIGIGLLARTDGTMSRRHRSGAVALISLILPAIVWSEYLISFQFQYFQPPRPDLWLVPPISLFPLVCFGSIWLCDVIRRA